MSEQAPNDVVTGYARGRADGYQAGVLSLRELERAAYQRGAAAMREAAAREAMAETGQFWFGSGEAHVRVTGRQDTDLSRRIRALPLLQEAGKCKP